MSNGSFGERLRERKVVQWALGYGAFALVVLELTDFLGDAFDWPVLFARVITVVVAFGFLAALVVAWHHGEHGHQRVRASEVLLLSVIALLGGSVAWWVGARAADEAAAEAGAAGAADPAVTPVAGVVEDGRTGLAVLPFRNFGGDPADEYFTDGMTEDIIAELSRAAGLRVISRTSVMQYKGVDKPIPEIGRELGVDVILEGSVRRENERVRIVAQLIDARTDEHLWTETYDRETRDILELQREVAQAIATALSELLGPEVRLADTGDRPRVDPEAYNLYLRGRQLAASASPADRERGSELLGEALARDSNVAVAITGMAEALMPMATGEAPEVPRPPALDSVIRAAMERIPQAAQRTTIVLRRALDAGDFPRAEEAARRALQENPNQPQTHRWYAMLLGRMGRHDEALEHLRSAQNLDPHSLVIATDIGDMLYAAGRTDEAIRQYEQVLRRHPEFVPARTSLGLALNAAGEQERAVAELRRAAEQSENNPNVLGSLGYVLAVAGQVEEARALVDSLQKVSGRRLPAAAIAHVHAGMGNVEEALKWLERSSGEHSSAILSPRLQRDLEMLRNDPRFAAMLQGRAVPDSAVAPRSRRDDGR